MSEHRATIHWERRTEDFSYDTYERRHAWRFEGGQHLSASAAPDFKGLREDVDPEEAFVASLSSCHMLTFLAIAARKRLTVDAYDDDAVGFMEKNQDGRLAITRVVLRPRIRFSGENQPNDEQIERLHDQAHMQCFIANSVRTEVRVERPVRDE